MAGKQPNKLRETRLRAALTQEELAAELGVSVNSLQAWERGVNFPRPRFQRKLAQLFRKTTDEMYDILRESADSTPTA